MTEPTPTPPSSLPPAELASLQAVSAALPAPPARPAKPPENSENTMAGVIDTVEAIIIALILALTFRAFVVEAFVIPTGSMAPTLLGAHFNVICPKCGYRFAADADLNFQYTMRNGPTISPNKSGELLRNTDIPCDDLAIICPNCSYQVPPPQLPQYLGTRRVKEDARNRAPGDVYFAWANNGDRILVLKYLYSVLEPHRWDVIVFKEPMYAHHNYIKRLIGLPGETIEVINGDIYVAPPGKTEPADRVIARKPPHIQEALWQLVYDNDFYPIDEGQSRDNGPAWTNPWIGAGDTAASWGKPQSASKPGPAIEYTAQTAGILQFSVRDPYTFNTLGYNRAHDLPADIARPPLMRVGDLRLETTWIPREKSGETIALVVGLPRNEFKAVWSPTGLEFFHYDVVTRRFESVEHLDATQVPPPQAGRGYNVALNNVDRAVQFFIDGKLVLEHITPWTAADALREKESIDNDPLIAAQKPDIRVEVGGACTLGHLKVMRDLYYTQNDPNISSLHTANTGYPLTLNQEEYFAMGDNSRRSHDGRTWAEVFPALDDLGTRHGVVPQRYLLGKAFFVYWPAGYRATESIPVLNEIPIVPDAGDMRFIR